MDEQEQAFTLEDIMKEFGDPAQEEPIPEEETAPQEEAFQEEPTEEPDEATEEIPEEPGETQQDAFAAGDTIRMDVVKFGKGTVHNAQPVDDEVDAAPQIPVQEEQTEPFSEAWEPEYEQPIAEYVPPRPILIHPRSKIRELKRKLVAGPEKQYYILLEQGLGKLQAAIFFCGLVALISAAATAIYAAGIVGPDRMKLMIFGQLLAMLICALLGSYQLLEGLADLKNKRFSLNTLLAFSFLFCVIDGVLCLQDLRVPCCAAFGLQMTMSLWSAYQRRNTKLGQLDTMRKATHLEGIGAQADYCEDGVGLLRGEGRVEDFMDHYASPSRLSRVLSVYAVVALCVSVALGIAAGVLHGISTGVVGGISTGVQVAAVTLLVSMPASIFVTISRPLAVLERRLHRVGAVICGWQGIEGLSQKAVFPITHADLFPGTAVKLNGVKFYGDRESDQVVAYCAALIGADAGALKPIFEHLLESRNGVHYSVDNFNAYDNGGIGGEINGEPVLVGTLEFLKQMGVEVPAGIRLQDAVGVSIDGQMCGLFALTYETLRSAGAGLQTLCGYRKLRPILVSGDFMLTQEFIGTKFSVRGKKVIFPEQSVRAALQAKTLEPDSPILAISTGNGLAPIAYCVTGARTAKKACTAGVVVHMIGGIVGIAMMVVLAVLGARELLTPLNMLLYQLVWMVPGLLITEWTRTI